ncbi:hypothetical protein HPC49_20470 [Pyxidicoccus fallax]|uniref:Lipoprotein n=1 Tax=Pyxidicoccus fallax TaxID=394095 RepID=A0A848L9V5_9BACT|nr:hypothetical protein [Pyxidicoccus fallax]NMO15324.1 hypothetical protein [Pyxidicoccus fallax]NPC80588.1 hypothetical protein [Pyxidicoccus fallax]
MRLASRLLALSLCVSTTALAKNNPRDRDGDGFIESSRYMPTTDPNLDPNWDWTVSGAGHTLYYTDATGIVRSTVRQVPFYTGGHPLNTLEKDMYPEDGWVLVYRDFGTPTSAPDLPFFALYNKYRGILRVMVFNTRELQFSRFNLELAFKSQTATGALLTFSEPTRAFTSDYDVAKREVFAVEANALNGWIHADFMLTGYDPNLSPDTQLRLNIRGLTLQDITLNADEFTLSQVFTNANPGGGAGGGTDLLGAINGGFKTYSTAETMLKSLRNSATRNSTAWWASTVLNLTQFVPYVGGLMGFVNSFFGGAEKPSPREPLNFQGALSMSGSITESTPLYSMDFATHYLGNGNPPDHYRPVRPITWGVFNLTAKPQSTVKFSRVCTGTTRPSCTTKTDYAGIVPVSYVFNPNAGLSLVSIEYAYTFDEQRPTHFTEYTPRVTIPQGEELPKGMALRVKLRTTTPTRYADDDLVFLKVYPFAGVPVTQ